MPENTTPFVAPSAVERLFTRLFGVLVGLGLGLPHNYLLQVRGRRSGRLYATPVDVLTHAGTRFVVAGRGNTQWVRNARASGQVVLRKGFRREELRVRELPDAEKPAVLKAYLDRFKLTVQRYFPVRAGSPAADFVTLAPRYPVFELIPAAPPDQGTAAVTRRCVVALGLALTALLPHAAAAAADPLDAERAALEDALKAADTVPGFDPAVLETLLDRLASIHSMQRRWAASADLQLRLLELRKRFHGAESEEVGRSCYALGFLHAAQGRYADAETHYRCYARIKEIRRGPNHPEYASALNSLAGAIDNQIRPAEAEALYRRALAIQRAAYGKPHQDIALTLMALTGVVRGPARYREAEALDREAISILEAIGPPDSDLLLFALGGLASSYAASSRLEEAELLNRRILAAAERKNPDDFMVLASSWRLGDLLRARGALDEAAPLLERAQQLQLRHMGPDYPHNASLLLSLADLEDARGNRDAARDRRRQALAHWDRIGARRTTSAANGMVLVAMDESARGRTDEARRLLREAVEIFEEWGGPRSVGLVGPLYQLALLEPDAGPALALLDRALELIQTYFQATSRRRDDTLRARRQYRAVVGAYLARAAGLGGASARAFEAAQLGTASETAQAVANMLAREAAGTSAHARLVRDYQDTTRAWQDVDAKLAEVAAPRTDAERARAAARRAESERLGARLAALEAEVAARVPAFRLLSDSATVPVEHVRRRLKPGEALVMFFLSAPRSHAWVVTSAGVQSAALEITTAQATELVRRLRRGLDVENDALPSFDHAAAHELYRRLLAPITPALAEVEHLIVVPDGPLQSLPLAVLLTEPPGADRGLDGFRDARWLVRRYALSTVPTVQAFWALRQLPPRRVAERSFAGIGDPVLEGPAGKVRGVSMAALYRRELGDVDEIRQLDRLPDARREILAMARTLKAREADLFLGARATEPLVRKADLSRYRVVTFATHGLVRGELSRAAEPALVLTPPARATEEDDGLLTAGEIAGLKLNADWVILSACNTAAADGTPGAEGLSGLTKSFFHAGARALLVSHWRVVSSAAMRLTTRMLEGYAGAGPRPAGKAQALRASMLELMADRSRPANAHPALWAPFVVVGDGG